jgi:hypothetical protein
MNAIQNKTMLIFLVTVMLSLQGCDSDNNTKSQSTPPPASAPSSSSTSASAGSNLLPGQKAILDNSHIDSQVVMVALTEQDLDEYIKAVNAQDVVGATQLSMSGRLLRVPNNTKVLVLESKGMKTNVRLMSGKQAWRSGWVLTPSVKPEK